MHHTAMENGSRFFNTYMTAIDAATVVDVGAQNINGSLREICPSRFQYIGVDFTPGSGVDIIMEDPYKLPLEDASADVVVSTSCFEHSELFWILYLEIIRVLKAEGLFYLNAPSNGPYHRFPVDCWRFYPDCAVALVHWARRQGFRPSVLESYVSDPSMIHQSFEPYQDLVSVFVKDEQFADRHPARILDSYSGFTNGFVRAGNKELRALNATWPLPTFT
jgi:SAM-dependent methyltransferase